jgi:hypothetical protein
MLALMTIRSIEEDTKPQIQSTIKIKILPTYLIMVVEYYTKPTQLKKLSLSMKIVTKIVKTMVLPLWRLIIKVETSQRFKIVNSYINSKLSRM